MIMMSYCWTWVARRVLGELDGDVVAGIVLEDMLFEKNPEMC